MDERIKQRNQLEQEKAEHERLRRERFKQAQLSDISLAHQMRQKQKDDERGLDSLNLHQV